MFCLVDAHAGHAQAIYTGLSAFETTLAASVYRSPCTHTRASRHVRIETIVNQAIRGSFARELVQLRKYVQTRKQGQYCWQQTSSMACRCFPELFRTQTGFEPITHIKKRKTETSCTRLRRRRPRGTPTSVVTFRGYVGPAASHIPAPPPIRTSWPLQ